MEDIAGQIIGGLVLGYAALRHYLIARTRNRILCLCGHRFADHQNQLVCERDRQRVHRSCGECKCREFIALAQAQIVAPQLHSPALPHAVVDRPPIQNYSQSVGRIDRIMPPAAWPIAVSCHVCDLHNGYIEYSRLPPLSPSRKKRSP